MSLKNRTITSNDVYHEAERIGKLAMEQLADSIEHLESAGLHDHANALRKFHARIETGIAQVDEEIQTKCPSAGRSS